MEKYLIERIAHLKSSEMEYFDKQYLYNKEDPLRNHYRETSNLFNARRSECEELLKILNNKSELT